MTPQSKQIESGRTNADKNENHQTNEQSYIKPDTEIANTRR